MTKTTIKHNNDHDNKNDEDDKNKNNDANDRGKGNNSDKGNDNDIKTATVMVIKMTRKGHK